MAPEVPRPPGNRIWHLDSVIPYPTSSALPLPTTTTPVSRVPCNVLSVLPAAAVIVVLAGLVGLVGLFALHRTILNRYRSHCVCDKQYVSEKGRIKDEQVLLRGRRTRQIFLPQRCGQV